MKPIVRQSLLLLALLCKLSASHAYDMDASGKILWRYYDGKSVGGSVDAITYNQNSSGSFPASTFTTYPQFSANYATTPALSAPSAGVLALQSSIFALLPEKRNIHLSSIALAGDDQTNIKIPNGKKVDVWLTYMVTPSSTAYQSSIGFFTYDPGAPPTRNADGSNNLHSEQIVFADTAASASSYASMPAANDAGGTTVYLGRFDGSSYPQGLGVGFFMVANGWQYNGRALSNGSLIWGVNRNVAKSAVLYSLRSLNPESPTTTDPFLNQHMLLMDDRTLTGSDQRSYERMVFAIEDSRRDLASTDSDFNDVVLMVHAAPAVSTDSVASVITNLASLPPATAAAAAPAQVQSLWYPGSNSWGTLAFEDLWPVLGDYDLNDILMRYRSQQILDASGRVSALTLNLRLDARGGKIHSGFAIALPGVTPAQVASANLTMNGQPVGTTLMPVGVTGQGGSAVFEIFPDATAIAPDDNSASCRITGYYNTGQDCPIQPFINFVLNVQFTNGLATFPSPPYDPFIFNTETSALYGKNVSKGAEVHLPGRQPSSRADTSLLGSHDDTSVLSNGSYSHSYQNAAGLPWVLDIPMLWDYPYELENVVKAYPNIVSWAVSGGSSYANWYATPVTAATTFRNAR